MNTVIIALSVLFLSANIAVIFILKKLINKDESVSNHKNSTPPQPSPEPHKMLLPEERDAETPPLTDRRKRELCKFGGKVDHYLKLDDFFVKNEISLEAVAKDMGVSADYVSKAVNVRYGKGFKQHLNEIRIARAIELAPGNPNLMAAEIFPLSGFRSIGAFQSAFLRQTGMTYYEWRISKKINQI